MLLRIFNGWRNSYQGIPRNIWFLAFINLVNRCGSMVIAFITIYLTQKLGFDIEDAGYVMGCFGVGALAGSFLGGKLTDRLGYYPVQLWSLILNGIMLIVLMQIQAFWPMCGAVFILSLVSECFRPANSVAVVRNSNPETRTRSVSLMRMAFNIGWTVAPALGGLLVAFGWNWLFWVDGVTCIAAAIVLRRLMPPKPSDSVEAIAAEEHHALVTEAVQSPYRDRRYLLFVLLTFLAAIVFMQIMWTVPVFFKENYHWSESMIGGMMALNGFFVFTIEMPLIFRIEGRRSTLSFVRLGLILYIISYLTFNSPIGPIGAAFIYMLVISFGEILVMPFSSNYMYGKSSKGNQGAYSALYGMAYSVANIAAPVLGTQVIAHLGYSTLWYMVSGISVLAIVGFWRLERLEHMHAVETVS
jgi:predicted MFS family arabinose efflux permease